MKTLDYLNQLIRQRQGHIDWYWVTWEPRHDYKSVGEVWRGYYLHCREPEYTSEPGRSNWANYVNGEYAGSTVREAKAYILEHVPALDNAHWYGEYKSARKEYYKFRRLVKDFVHRAHGVRTGIELGDFETSYRKRDLELFIEYLQKVQEELESEAAQ